MTKASTNEPKNASLAAHFLVGSGPNDGGAKRCWVISDGTIGMLSQSLAVLRMLGIDGEDLRAIPTPILRLFPALAAIPGWQLTLGRKPDWLKAGIYPDLLITCGKRMAGISIGVRRLAKGRTKTIHIQDPQIKADHFDLLIVPAHDHIAQNPPANLLISTGSLNRLSPEEIAADYNQLPDTIKALKAPITAVMIGGHNRRYKAGRESFTALGAQLKAFASIHHTSLALIPSRRTPSSHLNALCSALSDIPYYLWDGRTDNPYPGILGLADYIIVTSDSVNMITEACITGKPVLSAYLANESGRIAYFHKMMEDKGHIAKLETILTTPQRLNAGFLVLDERERLARQIRAFFSG